MNQEGSASPLLASFSMSKDLKKILRPIYGDIKRVNTKIGELIYTGVPLIDESCSHLFHGGGKSVRAALVLLSAGLKEVESPPDVYNLAAAMEIIHGASLIHDDIIDRGMLRRGVESVHAKFGEKVAVLAGDFLYSLAMDIAANYDDKRVLLSMIRASNELVRGELLQLEYSSLDKISEERYFEIIDSKTGQLMASAVEVGAYVGGFSLEDARKLYSAGLALGYAFQIVDDVMDYSSDSKTSGKMSGKDYQDGKVTLPLLYVVEKGTAQEVSLLHEILADSRGDRFSELRDLVEQSGALEYSREMARSYSKKALEVVEKYGSGRYGKIFCELIDFIIERNY